MSHEIRTPLNGILGMADLIAQTKLDDEQQEMLSTLRDSGWSLLSLLNDILDLSRVEAGKLELECNPFDLAPMIERLVALHGANAQSKGVVLDLVTQGDLRQLRIGDQTRLMQILHNLLSNAVKFTNTGRITLEIDSQDSQSLTFRINDTGIGMSKEQVARIYNMFEQAEASTTRRFGGSGLGMTIVRRLITLMGGEIAIDTALGQGTRISVHVMIPTPAPTTVPRALPRSASLPTQDAALRGIRALVADDNATNRKLLAAILSKLGVIAEFACDGAEALALWRENSFDVVLLDISMPVCDGVEALHLMQQSARQAGRAPPVALAVTANVMTDQVRSYLDEGFLDTIPKPISRDILIEKLQKAMTTPA